jgi:hypothetical protein
MPEMVRLAEIAKRLKLDLSTVRRLIAKHAEPLQLSLHRGKHDRLYLSAEDAEKLIASYEARRGSFVMTPEVRGRDIRFVRLLLRDPVGPRGATQPSQD